jgi:hypothetical protein
MLKEHLNLNQHGDLHELKSLLILGITLLIGSVESAAGPPGNVVGVLRADGLNARPELLAPAATLGDIARTDFELSLQRRPTLTSYPLSPTPEIHSFSFPQNRITF